MEGVEKKTSIKQLLEKGKATGKLTTQEIDAAIVAMTNYESIMYRANMSTEAITTAEFYYPFLYCGAVIISGFLARPNAR